MQVVKARVLPLRTRKGTQLPESCCFRMSLRKSTLDARISEKPSLQDFRISIADLLGRRLQSAQALTFPSKK